MKLNEFLPDLAAQNQSLVKMNTAIQNVYDGGFASFAKGRMGGGVQTSSPSPLGIEQLYFDWLRTAYAYRRQFIQDLYLLAYDVTEIRTPLLHLRGEIFRKGLDAWIPKFAVKCERCGEEYDEVKKKCARCGNKEMKKPDHKQVEYFDEMRKSCNIFGQSFEEILQTCEDDMNIVDDCFVHLQKQYLLAKDTLWSRVLELRRIHPALMEYDLDKAGLPRNSHWLCPFHREDVEIAPGPCKECGFEMLPVMYIYNHRGKRVYLLEEEIIHMSKFSPSETYGYSPLLTIMQKVLTISGMDRFLYRYFFERKAPTGMILTYTDDPQSLEVERARIEAKMMEDPTYMPWVAVSQKTGRGRTDFVRLFHTLQEMDYMNVRNEIRDRIASMYGVPQVYLNIFEGVGAMSGQSVSGDTPLWIRKDEKFIDLIPIESLHHNSANQHDQFPKNLEVLSQDGWTKPKHIWRHKCREENTLAFEFGGGFAETTVDHSLMKDKQEVKASDLKVGDSIDTVEYPKSEEYDSMTEDFAWLLGFYSAEGSILFEEAGLDLSNNKVELLEKCQRILEARYNKKAKIAFYEGNDCGRVLIYGNSIVEDFKGLVYYAYNTVSSKDSKPIRVPKLVRKVPTQVINGSSAIKQSFLKGYIDGDGSVTSDDSYRCVSTSLLLLAGIEYLVKILGYNTNVEFRKSDNQNWNHNWRLTFGKGNRKTESNVIKRILSLPANKYVYDIETESHTFVGGIGCLVFHNSQQLKVFSNIIDADQRRYNEKLFPQLLKAFHITDWSLKLLPPEEKIDSMVLQQAQQRVAIATQMMTLGFQVELKPGTKNIKDLDFIFTGKVENPMQAMMGGAGGAGGMPPLPPGGEGSQGGEGAEGGASGMTTAPPRVPEKGVEKAEGIEHYAWNKRNPKEEAVSRDIEAEKIYQGKNLEEQLEP